MNNKEFTISILKAFRNCSYKSYHDNFDLNHEYEKVFDYLFTTNFKFSDDTILKYSEHIIWNKISLNPNRFRLSPDTKEKLIRKCFVRNGFLPWDFCKFPKSPIAYFEQRDKFNIDFKPITDKFDLFYPYQMIRLESLVNKINQYFSLRDFENYSPEEADELKDIILSCIEGIKWNIIFIKLFKDRLNWRLLSFNKGIHFDITIVEIFKDYWDWNILSYNPNIPFDIEFLTKFKDQINWEFLSANKSTGWNESIIQHFVGEWNWDDLSRNTSINWDYYTVVRFRQFINWKLLSNNPRLELSEKLLLKFKDKLLWEGEEIDDIIDDHGNYVDFQIIGRGISSNPSFRLTKDPYGHLKNRLDWVYLSSSPHICWSEEIINKYRNKLSWGFIFDKSLSIEEKKANLHWELESQVVSQLNIPIPIILNNYQLFDGMELFRNELLEWTPEFLKNIIYEYLALPKKMGKVASMLGLKELIYHPNSDRINKEENNIFDVIDYNDAETISILKTIAENKSIFKNIFSHHFSEETIERILFE